MKAHLLLLLEEKKSRKKKFLFLFGYLAICIHFKAVILFCFISDILWKVSIAGFAVLVCFAFFCCLCFQLNKLGLKCFKRALYVVKCRCCCNSSEESYNQTYARTVPAYRYRRRSELEEEGGAGEDDVIYERAVTPHQPLRRLHIGSPIQPEHIEMARMRRDSVPEEEPPLPPYPSPPPPPHPPPPQASAAQVAHSTFAPSVFIGTHTDV